MTIWHVTVTFCIFNQTDLNSINTLASLKNTFKTFISAQPSSVLCLLVSLFSSKFHLSWLICHVSLKSMFMSQKKQFWCWNSNKTSHWDVDRFLHQSCYFIYPNTLLLFSITSPIITDVFIYSVYLNWPKADFLSLPFIVFVVVQEIQLSAVII